MKIVCIYHCVDLDGWMSAAIVKHWFNSTVEIPNVKGVPINTLQFIGYNYGQPIPDLSEYDKVIMCDISFPIDEMEKLRQIYQDKFIWIDHHISAIKAADERTNNYYEGLRDTKFAACELTWKYFFPNEPMPEIVRLLGRYDCFGHKGTDKEQEVLEFQYGARQCISNYEEAYVYLYKHIESSKGAMLSFDISIDGILNKGKAIYQYLCTEAKQTYKNGFEVWFNNGDNTSAGCTYKFICINKERFNPINFGIDYHKDGYDGCACFHYANGMWNFSIYNDNGLVDCSVIAKQYGGGGHKGAAGFILNNANFNNLIFNSTLINYCIEVRRGGIGEEDCVLHHKFSSPPTKEDIEAYLISEDIGYDPKYCSYEFYQI